MSTNIYDIANELERAIRQLPEYQAVVEKKNAIYADATAKKVFDDYLAFQQELQAMMQAGTMPDKKVHAKMKDMDAAIKGNALLSGYFEKHQQLSIYLADIEKLIFKPMQDLF